jgi:hypothetical protein
MRYALRLRRMNLCQLRNERDAVAAETQRLLTIDTLHDLAGCGCDCHLTRTIGTIERKRQRAEQADREAARTIRPGVAP